MRERPDFWTGPDRVQWGCVLMAMLGEQSLAHLHLVLSGLRSVEQSRQAAPAVAAIHTARALLGDLVTRQAVQSAVYTFVEDGRERRFDINVSTLEFTPRFEVSLDSVIVQAEQILREGLPYAQHGLTAADVNRDLFARTPDGRTVPLRFTGVQPPPVRHHNTRARERQPIVVTIEEIRTLAEALVAEDRAAGRKPKNWPGWLNFVLQHTTGQGLAQTDTLDLTGLHHLIGVPGAGKTTLLTLLCVLLARRGLRVAVFFTSIEVARSYLEVLRRYNVRTGLLVGHSDQTHRTHANRIAEVIAGQGDGGFARTREGADLLGLSCPLPAFSPSAPSVWPLGYAPCEHIYDAETEQRHLCPLWSMCGRVKNARELIDSQVWLGHVLSADTRVPAHASEERLRHAELIQRTFDLVIFDECDETQHVLDAYGALTLDLSGSEQSLMQRVHALTGQLSANQTRATEGTYTYALLANEFGRHALRLGRELRAMRDARSPLIENYADKLLTSAFLLRDAITTVGKGPRIKDGLLTALSDLWERALYGAFVHRVETDDTWPKADIFAPVLGISVEEANSAWHRIRSALTRSLQRHHTAALRADVAVCSEELAQLIGCTPASIEEHVRLLVAVGFTIASYQQLAHGARPLILSGEIPADLVSARASDELRAMIPRSILGTLSGVRYRPTMDGNSFAFDYLVMDSTPRLLARRLAENGSVNVLLTSATSYIHESTTYHVDVRPTYLLAPKTPQQGRITLYFKPEYDRRTNAPIFYSGAGLGRERNLQEMVTQLATPRLGGPSELEKVAAAHTTPLGKPRKVALIVNSYVQVSQVVEQIAAVNPALSAHTRGVVLHLPHGYDRVARPRYILKGQIDDVAADGDVHILVFPMGALGRGTNIVFATEDSDNGRAAIGAIFFLTRPHPAVGDLSLVISLLARATEALDARDMRHLSLSEARTIVDRERYVVYENIASILARPMAAHALPKRVLPHFAANLLVPILQAIGRGTRGGMPVEVYFVDAAWAPRSAVHANETDRSSVLILMQQMLTKMRNHPDGDTRAVYEALYGGAANAFGDVLDLQPVDYTAHEEEETFHPSPVTVEVDLDGADAEPVEVFDEEEL